MQLLAIQHVAVKRKNLVRAGLGCNGAGRVGIKGWRGSELLKLGGSGGGTSGMGRTIRATISEVTSYFSTGK